MQNKTFRLFISSTFSDFKEERNRLQKELFPFISEYCAKSGFSFQPVDLRWGINEEAQLDQKTLELCLEEVHNCKKHIYPNFLIMLGDRYGWVPLPYLISRDIFTTILNTLPNEEDKKRLFRWYSLDENQLPASYILKRRTAPYDNYEIWSKEELEVRTILQKAVKKIAWREEIKQDFFFSATEHELREGIYKYLDPTFFQKELAVQDHRSPAVEDENTFGFIRHITSESSYGRSAFVDEDSSHILKVKERLKRAIPKKNIYEVTTELSADGINIEYLDSFILALKKFLMNSIDKQVEAYREKDAFEHEQEEQTEFLNTKKYLFQAQKEALSYLRNYLKSDSCEPMVIYGASGSGKSSFMAQLISLTQDERRSVYTFVGATNESTNSKGVLNYICKSLTGVTLKDNDDFTKFSISVRKVLERVKEPTYLFIDALDQLVNNDRLIWLPEKLNKNLKIVITVLNDATYSEDSKFYRLLEKRFTTLYKLPKLQNPRPILNAFLIDKQRLLQPHQMDYVVEKYKHNFSPLYLRIVLEAVKNWRSYDQVGESKTVADARVHSLSDTQKEVIKEYIKNLVTVDHIDEKLVQKVFSYIYISPDGMSEVELIDMLSEDKEFLKIVAPETYHKNLTQRLPVAIWSRLLYHINICIITKKVDGYTLIQYFHREISTAVKESFDINFYHKELISLLEKLIVKKQYIPFSNNRIGVLYSQVSTRYVQEYDDKNFLDSRASFIATLENKHWIKAYIAYVLKRASVYDYAFDKKAYIELLKIKYLTKKIEIDEDQSFQIAKFYHKLGGYEYLHVNWKVALKTLLIAVELLENFINKNPLSSLESAKETLSQTYGRIGEMFGRYADGCESIGETSKQKKIKKAINYHTKSEKLNKELLLLNPSNIEYNRKLGVVYERFATAYSVINKEQDIRSNYAKAIKYKSRAYNRKSDLNGFTMRKLFIVIITRYIVTNKKNKILLYLRRIEKSIKPYYIDDAIAKNNQYYLEQYIKFYKLADYYCEKNYEKEIIKIEAHLKKRGLASEY